MENRDFANASLNDIVFAGRNREYGAYMLRTIYSKHLIRGLIIAVSLFIFFLGLPIITKALFPEEVVVEEPKVIDVNMLAEPPAVDKTAPPPPPPPPPVEPPPPPVQKTIKFTPPVIKKDEMVRKEEVPDQDDLKEAVIDVKTQEGNTTKPNLEGLEGGTGKSEVAPAVEEIFTFVEQMPQFPGGEAAMLKFINENMVYPPLAKRMGLEGLVVVSFVVNQKGEIADIQILKKLGGGTDEEAVRVVKAMPKWSPGKNNGRPASVRFTLPFRFNLK